MIPGRARRGAELGLWLGLALLYLPLVLMVAYSFNASRLVTVWGGWSLRWYAGLLENGALLEAARRSVLIAAASATLATLLGTALGHTLARGDRLRGRALLESLTLAPLVLPEVLLGLALLLSFVLCGTLTGWPETRGIPTVVIAHTTLTFAYVTVVVQSRLAGLDPALEEAARDLGATPVGTFIGITLPLMWPGIAAGWLLAFTLSLDDLVIASFTSGPGASTLPILAWSKIRLGLSPEINALASVLIAGTGLALALASWSLRRRADPAAEVQRDAR